jgi:hypothetical protein
VEFRVRRDFRSIGVGTATFVEPLDSRGEAVGRPPVIQRYYTPGIQVFRRTVDVSPSVYFALTDHSDTPSHGFILARYACEFSICRIPVRNGRVLVSCEAGGPQMVSMTWRVLDRFWFHLLVAVLACALPFEPILLSANQVPVRHTEGLMHGFLALRSLDGKRLADGEMTQVAEGDRVTSRLIFRFKDGSVYDDTTIFSQRGAFRLLSDHLVERGPSFKQNMETSVEASTGQIMVRYKDKDGEEKVLKEQHELPPDVANGLLFTLVKHIQPTVPETTVSMVATTPKPRVVKLEIIPEGKKAIASGNTKHETVHYVVKVKIGGVAGFVAPLLGKQPRDTHVWVLTGNAPAFVKMEGPLYDGGQIWRIELATPAGF